MIITCALNNSLVWCLSFMLQMEPHELRTDHIKNHANEMDACNLSSFWGGWNVRNENNSFFLIWLFLLKFWISHGAVNEDLNIPCFSETEVKEVPVRTCKSERTSVGIKIRSWHQFYTLCTKIPSSVTLCGHFACCPCAVICIPIYQPHCIEWSVITILFVFAVPPWGRGPV